MNYHFPIILGRNQSERIVMIHLSDTKPNDNETRVVITQASDESLFRIFQQTPMIEGNLGTANLIKDVDYVGLQTIEWEQDELQKTIATLKKRIAEYQEKIEASKDGITPLSTTEIKKLERLQNDLNAAEKELTKKGQQWENGIHSLKGRTELVVKSNNTTLKRIQDGRFFRYSAKDDRDGRFDADIEFSLIVKHGEYNDERTYTGKLHIIRPSGNDEVVKINVDLGSDATQVNYFTESAGAEPQPINLVDAMMGLYTSRKYGSLKPPQNGDPLFIQQEKGTDTFAFYKTGNITFYNDPEKQGNIRKKMDEEDTFINYLNVSAAGKNENDPLIASTTWGKEEKYSTKLINIKMLYANLKKIGSFVNHIKFCDDSRKDLPLNDRNNLLLVLRSIYRQIIEASIKRIPLSKNAQQNNRKYYSVLLLIPNIYVQQNIDYLIYELNKLNWETENDDIKYDFRVISESDAAFVGIKSTPTTGLYGTVLGDIIGCVKDPKQKDIFLIIDAGKGTTDYSIIRYDSGNSANNSMFSIKRGGIVGAGGTIDYVFARVLARQIYENLQKLSLSTSIKQNVFVYRFMTMIQHLSNVDQDQIMLIIETLKKNYNDEKRRTANAFDCFNQKNAKNIIAALLSDEEPNYAEIKTKTTEWKEVSKWHWNDTFYPIREEDKTEIDWVCKTIAKNVCDSVFKETPEALTKQIDYIIFTGRSFLFMPLRSAFLAEIEQYRGVYAVNYSDPLPYVKLVNWFRGKKDLKEKKDLRNLKSTTIKIDMKAISVWYDRHDLGINCNSDFCCTNLLSIVDEKGKCTFSQDQFWEGFKKMDDGRIEKHYYIGHPDRSFSPTLNQVMVINALGDEDRDKLIHMTMFPVKYIVVFDDNLGINLDRSTSPVPSIQPDHDGQNPTDDNSLDSSNSNLDSSGTDKDHDENDL